MTHWKRPWCWERLKVGREGDDRVWDGWMASPTQWTWVWASSGSWWWTESLACCSPWGCKESYMTEQLNWTELKQSINSVQSLSKFWWIFFLQKYAILEFIWNHKRLKITKADLVNNQAEGIICPVFKPYYNTCIYILCMPSRFSCVWLFSTPWTVVYQTPLSVEFSRQEYWSGLPFPIPGDLPNQGSNPHLLLLLYSQADSLLLVPPGKPIHYSTGIKIDP